MASRENPTKRKLFFESRTGFSDLASPPQCTRQWTSTPFVLAVLYLPPSRWSSTSRPAARPQIRPRTSRESAKTSCWARRGSRISSRSKISTSISPRCARAACPCLNPSSAAGFTHEAARRRSSCSVPVAFGAAPTRRVAYCQPVLVVCSRSAAVGRTARRLAVGNARYLPHFLQNALLVASISLYKLTS